MGRDTDFKARDRRAGVQGSLLTWVWGPDSCGCWLWRRSSDSVESMTNFESRTITRALFAQVIEMLLIKLHLN